MHLVVLSFEQSRIVTTLPESRTISWCLARTCGRSRDVLSGLGPPGVTLAHGAGNAFPEGSDFGGRLAQPACHRGPLPCGPAPSLRCRPGKPVARKMWRCRQPRPRPPHSMPKLGAGGGSPASAAGLPQNPRPRPVPGPSPAGPIPFLPGMCWLLSMATSVGVACIPSPRPFRLLDRHLRGTASVGGSIRAWRASRKAACPQASWPRRRRCRRR
jgi:hypothetical protein